MMKKITSLLTLLLVGTLFTGLAGCSKAPKILQGSLVEIEYTVKKLTDGKLVQSNKGMNQPLVILIGANKVLPAVEKQIQQMVEGQTKKFIIKAAEAYGEYDPKKKVTVPRKEVTLPEKVGIKEGGYITSKHKDPKSGKPVQQTVKLVKLGDKEVTLDYNHFLAGEDLEFELKLLKVVDISKAPKVDVDQLGKFKNQDKAKS